MVICGLSLLVPPTANAGEAGELVIDHRPSLEMQQAWDRFQSEHPDAKVRWGRKFDRPYIIYNFAPVELTEDYDATVAAFIAENADLFGLAVAPGGRVSAELGPGEVVYSCDNDELEPLPGWHEGEWFEPDCVETTLVKFPQYVNGYEAKGSAFSATFDKQDRLIALQGEHMGYIDAPIEPAVTTDQLPLLLTDYYEVDPEQIVIRGVEMVYKFIGELTPVWEVDFVLEREDYSIDLLAEIDADSGRVLYVEDFIDESDVNVYGWAMRNKAAYICNEPTLKTHTVDNTYFSNNKAAPFNSAVHVYDFETLSDDTFYPTYSNGNYLLFWKYFNHRCDPADADPTGDTCYNDQNTLISLHDISVYTAFSALVTAYNYAHTLGFERNNSPDWVDNQPLVAIINDDDGYKLCCGETECAIACFSSEGYPRDNYSGNDYQPSWAVDRYDSGTNPITKIPTMSVYMRENPYEVDSSESFYEATDFVTTLHEFYHWVVRTYMQNGGYTFNGNEKSAINEGFAIYWAASLVNESSENFYRDSLKCNSDDTESGISMLLDYAETFQCCIDRHDGGRVISQILWDLRNGIGNGVEEFGQYYTDKLLVYTTSMLGSQSIETIEDLYDWMYYTTDNGLLGTCPLGANSDCADNITAAFNRHGVCTSFPCAAYVERTCNAVYPNLSCEDIPCLGSDSKSVCPQVFVPYWGLENAKHCSRTNEEEPICCRTICEDNWTVLNGCNLFSSQAECKASCIGEEWSYAYRECLYEMTSQMICTFCDHLAP